MGCHFLLQGIFPTQGSNPGFPRCRQLLYHLSHLGSPIAKHNKATSLSVRAAQSLSCVQPCVASLTVALQASLSMGFLRQDNWTGLLGPSPGDPLDPGIKPTSSALAGGFFTTEPPGKPQHTLLPEPFPPCQAGALYPFNNDI